MNVTESTQMAAGISVLKAAIKQPELALELLINTVETMANSGTQAQVAEVPASPMQGAIIDIQI